MYSLSTLDFIKIEFFFIRKYIPLKDTYHLQNSSGLFISSKYTFEIKSKWISWSSDVDEVIGVYTLYNSIQYLIHGLLQIRKKLYKKNLILFFYRQWLNGRWKVDWGDCGRVEIRDETLIQINKMSKSVFHKNKWKIVKSIEPETTVKFF